MSSDKFENWEKTLATLAQTKTELGHTLKHEDNVVFSGIPQRVERTSRQGNVWVDLESNFFGKLYESGPRQHRLPESHVLFHELFIMADVPERNSYNYWISISLW